MISFNEWMKYMEEERTPEQKKADQERNRRNADANELAMKRRNSTIGDDKEVAADAVGANFPKYKTSQNMKKR